MSIATPRTTRIGVWLFLMAFAVCGIFGVEAWPLTGFRLFANAREQHGIAWTATAVNRIGEEQSLVRILGNTAPAGLGASITTFNTKPLDAQQATCNDWLELTRQRDYDVAAIRVYRTDTDLALRDGDRGIPGSPVLTFTCPESGGVQRG